MTTRFRRKTRRGDVIVVARLAPSKRIDHAIRAAHVLAATGWTGRLHVVGEGPDRARLEASARSGPAGVVFHGRVDEVTRRELYRASSVTWLTSVREGWGLVITEAARHGTPAVVYDVPGLRDAVRDGVTGFVVPADPQALAAATRRVLDDLTRLAIAALRDSARFTWEASADAFERSLLGAIEDRALARRDRRPQFGWELWG